MMSYLIMKSMEETPRTNNQLSWGRRAMSTYGLIDLSFAGYRFMWENGKVGVTMFNAGWIGVWQHRASSIDFHLLG